MLRAALHPEHVDHIRVSLAHPDQQNAPSVGLHQARIGAFATCLHPLRHTPMAIEGQQATVREAVLPARELPLFIDTDCIVAHRARTPGAVTGVRVAQVGQQLVAPGKQREAHVVRVLVAIAARKVQVCLDLVRA